MIHTKETDKASIKRIRTLSARSLCPDDYDNLNSILDRLEERVESRIQDEQEDE